MKLRHTLEGHQGQVSSARFGPDGRRVALGSRDKTISIWSLRGGKRERVLEGHRRAITCLAFTPTGELVSADSGGGVKIWSWPRGKLLHEIDEHIGAVYTLGSSADGSLIASGAKDETICVWSRETGELVHRYEVGSRGMSFVFSADGEHLVSGRGGDTLCFWSLETGELAWEQEAGPGMVGAFTLDRTGEWVVSRGWRGPVTIWSASAWGYAAVLPIVEKGLVGATLRPEHEEIVCVFERGLAIYSAENGAQLDYEELPVKHVHDVDVSPDARYVVTASADELGRIYELDEYELDDDDDFDDDELDDDDELEDDE